MPQPPHSIQPCRLQVRQPGSLAAADEAAQVHLGAGLGEREVVRPQPGGDALAEHRLGEVVQGALAGGPWSGPCRSPAPRSGGTPGCGWRRARRCGTPCPGRPRRSGSFALEQGAGLHRGGVRAQHQARLGRVDEERVLHLPRRVVGAEVQGVEVEPLGLELGPLGDLVAHRDEDVGDALLQGGAAGAGRRAAAGEGSVTSTVSSTRTRSSRSASNSAWRAASASSTGRGPPRCACRPRPWRPAAARRSRGWPGRAASGRRRARAGPA